MNKNCLLVAASVLLMLSSFAQNVGINADGARPNPNAILDIKSVNKGLLIPRMDSIARKAIPNTKGLLVYDISSDNFWYNTGKEWKCILNDKDRGKEGDAWLLKGNGDTKDGINFLGTTNNVPLNIRMNNQPSGRIDSVHGSTFWGYLAGASDTSGLHNTANGFRALYSSANGDDNTAVGYESLSSNTYASGNTAVGYQALYSTTASGRNTVSGYRAMFSNTLGGNNSAQGYEALGSNISGSYNVAIGVGAMFTNIDGSNNTAVGVGALDDNTSGWHNTATGLFAMIANTTGNYNVANGEYSLGSNTLGNGNTAIGYFADVNNGQLTNATALGYEAIVDASNKVRIGNSAVTVIEGQVPFTTPSDGRYKFNVQEDVKGLDFILNLRPVTYQFDVKRFDAHMSHQPGNPDGPANYALQTGYDLATRIRRSGFIAQEVEQAANTSGYDFSGIIKPKTDEDHYSLSYDAFVVPLVKAVQEQQQIIQQQNKKLEEQDKRLVSLQAQFDELKKLLQPTN
jgi:trimeric autotransporter adhesin